MSWRGYLARSRSVNYVTNTRYPRSSTNRFREQLLQYGHEAFESKNITKREHRLQSENKRLKEIIGDLTVEFKKKRVRMMRKRSVKIKKRNEPVLSMVRNIKACHPFWGYRRCWAYLYYREGIKVNKKRIYRLMRENDLLVNKKDTKRREDQLVPSPRLVIPITSGVRI